MSPANGYQAPSVSVSSSLPKRKVDSSVLIVPVVSGDDDGVAPSVVPNPFLGAEAVGEIEAALESLDAKGGVEQITRVVVPSLPVSSVLAVGLGKRRDEYDADVVRRVAGVAARSLNGAETALTTLSDIDLGATVEGLILGAYRFTDFRSDKTAPKDAGLRAITALTSAKGQKDAAQRAADIATAVATARNLVNTPPSHLFPAEFAKRAKALGEAAGLQVEILDEKALEKAGYGGIIGVGKGSSRPPRLVRLTHKGAKRNGKRVALVGKGITFDTGGISIKPAANMHHMTSDMGGAAAVIATVVLAAKQKLPIDVVATVPMAENMPSSTAQRPGDVLTQYGGITVEVLNTDAEGRLVLADAIVRAGEDQPDYLIETSTLTGAQTVALGARTPGVMGSDEFRDRVAELSQRVGENGWPMPLPEELKEDLKSTVADLANVGGSRYAGMLVAGTYLREFVPEGVQWAHIDIAGPAYNTGGPWGYTGKGGTGVPTRTMFAVLEDIAANG
ncbi:leucyl aminopeptidase [Mycolicibacterium pulveris]|uniref:Probable cytosol aminopeptidase n=1 Tax=Mycolicibacterium pulveris TaxID=36813 RepID=A0A7I7UT43_MYCPV|nr:leucyl aminopeptidase [Mycolicibacterium pulveris]MCV6983340.1 leucyl aminopeptidase [Mycolicibacterium pulveris]BBY83216.1 putative cytosol aminopeptidase [Mycolicibacterium pulveris]